MIDYWCRRVNNAALGAILEHSLRNLEAQHRQPRTSRVLELNDLIQWVVSRMVRFSVYTLPEKQWPVVAGVIARASMMLRPSRRRMGISQLKYFFPEGVPGNRDPEELLAAITRRHLQETMVYARLHQRPDWRPPISVTGLESIASEQQQGRGVVLWLVPQVATHILMRIALNDAGYRVCHLRNWMHGPSSTWFGRAMLNPLYWRVENRLADHVVIPPQGPLGAVRQIRQRLRAGAVVSLRGLGSSNVPLRLPLFGGTMKLATGAPRIALAEDSALICVRCEPADPGWKIEFIRLRANGEVTDLESLVQGFLIVARATFLNYPDLWPVHHQQFATGNPG